MKILANVDINILHLTFIYYYMLNVIKNINFKLLGVINSVKFSFLNLLFFNQDIV